MKNHTSSRADHCKTSRETSDKGDKSLNASNFIMSPNKYVFTHY